ncbi:MAG: hypothetical protein EOM21_15935 [Gammaproteobacteria bacterium]|nr:hypothetical protein [Gammaproteobacteria bacterium]
MKTRESFPYTDGIQGFLHVCKSLESAIAALEDGDIDSASLELKMLREAAVKELRKAVAWDKYPNSTYYRRIAEEVPWVHDGDDSYESRKKEYLKAEGYLRSVQAPR